MQNKIHNFLILDYLGKADAIYDLADYAKIIVLNSELETQVIENPGESFQVPLAIKLQEPWLHAHKSQKVDIVVEKFLLDAASKAAKYSGILICNNVIDALSAADEYYTRFDLGGLDLALVAENLKNDHTSIALYTLNRRVVYTKLLDNQVICMPSSELTGCISIAENYKSIGMFVILSSLLSIKINLNS